MKILSAVQMGEVDRLTTERYRIPSILLMENAGRSVADEMEKSCPGLKYKRVLVCCGRGNNGGDGFVAARYLALRGAHPLILLFGDPEKLKGDARTNWDIVRAMGLDARTLAEPSEAKAYLRKATMPDVIVDALFGTGLSKPIGPDFRPIVDWINQCRTKAFVTSIDIPSGLMADSSEIAGPVVNAHLTVTFTALKLAQVMPPAVDRAGKVVLVPIGSPDMLLENPDYRLNLVDCDQVRRTLPSRARESHKGSFGHIFVVAGSGGKSGAALMAGLSALRAGAGLVTLWIPASLQTSVAGKYPELMLEVLPETAEGTLDHSGAEKVLASLDGKDSLVVGPGLTTHPSTRKLVWELVRRSPVPVILDADGINAFVASAEPMKNELGQPIIITPHPGEMARLTGKTVPDVQKSRIQTALSCAAECNCNVVLKGFQTVIATPDGALYLNNTGNPGMATGGTGDILSGVMGRFAAAWRHQSAREQTHGIADFICAAVYLHGLAGDLAAQEKGMESLIATDLLEYLPAAFRKVSSS